MAQAAVPFPDSMPAGYKWLEDEPRFDPACHLALEMPATIHTLDELGYGEDEIKGKATRVAASSPFRILSDEGAKVLLQVARNLRDHAVSCERIENMVRGGCYRSRFLRDLCTAPSITEMMCAIYGIDVAPHTMPVHLGHMNFAPQDLSRAVDKWHHDTLPLDYVMMVTDPAAMSGGRFEYFAGTRHEAAVLAEKGETPPPERVVAPDFPGPGYAIALHGDMVVHRGAALNEPAERITMVNGYINMDITKDDQHRMRDLIKVDDPECLYTEWAKHAAWRARGKLDSLIDSLAFTSDRDVVVAALEAAVRDVSLAVDEMKDETEQRMHYYGG